MCESFFCTRGGRVFFWGQGLKMHRGRQDGEEFFCKDTKNYTISGQDIRADSGISPSIFLPETGIKVSCRLGGMELKREQHE